jgi:hypothetical protein
MNFRNPFRRNRTTLESNPFKDKISLAQFLGKTAGLLINRKISQEEAHEVHALTLDFYKLLAFKDFSFELLDLGSAPDSKERRLPYST